MLHIHQPQSQNPRQQQPPQPLQEQHYYTFHGFYCLLLRRQQGWLCRWHTSSSQLQLIKVLLLITLCSSLVSGGMTKRARKPYGKHFIIHVPVKLRSHHHTHTVFTSLKGVGGGSGGGGGSGESGKGTKQTIYKIMGYSTHHTSAGIPGAAGGGNGIGYGRHYAHGHGHGFGRNYKQGHRIGGSGYGEINYDDYTNTNCDNAMAPGDMIFNHYSRQDEEYPEVVELIEDDEREGDEWEE